MGGKVTHARRDPKKQPKQQKPNIDADASIRLWVMHSRNVSQDVYEGTSLYLGIGGPVSHSAQHVIPPPE